MIVAAKPPSISLYLFTNYMHLLKTHLLCSLVNKAARTDYTLLLSNFDRVADRVEHPSHFL